MIETALVYIRRTKPAKAFVGCGVAVEGGYIATCRHVWRDATTGGETVVEVEYPHCWQAGAMVTSAATQAYECAPDPDRPPPDLVLLQPDRIPAGVTPVRPATQEKSEVGEGYAIAGLPGLDLVVQEVRVRGCVADTLRGDGRRQFTGGNANGYWTDRGSSGSPVFVGTGEQLAGIISLSQTGKTAGASPLHEGFIVPGTTIRKYLQELVAAPTARDENIPTSELQPVLEAIGATGIPLAEIPGRLRAFVEGARAQAAQAVSPSNDGADILAAIGAARDKMGNFDPAGAREVLQAKIDEEEQTRRQRVLPLLRERVSVERLASDYEAAKATLAEIAGLVPDATWDWIRLGDLCQTTGSLAAALDAYGKAEMAARRNGDERDLSISHERIGEVRQAQGDLDAAVASYTAGMAIIERLAARDPANSERQRDLSVSHNKLGDVKRAQGDVDAAVAAYTAGMAISERLAAGDPANSEWQRDLSVGHDRLGDVQLAQGALDAAVAAYTAGMAIREQLAARDPANSERQRDLSVSHNKLGDVKLAQGVLDAAVAAYTAGMAITERLAARDPANSDWQRALSVSYERIGEVKLAQGDLDAALAAYTAGMAIRERLAARDPANSEWQRALVVSCVSMADVAPDQAFDLYTRALDIVRGLAASGRLAPADAWMPGELESRLAALPRR
jgi:tetratricopeptide (TPR) repeat protein